MASSAMHHAGGAGRDDRGQRQGPGQKYHCLEVSFDLTLDLSFVSLRVPQSFGTYDRWRRIPASAQKLFAVAGSRRFR